MMVLWRCFMYITEQYLMYRLAYNLVTNDKFDVLHVNTKDGEIWLEKYEHRVSKVIRLFHKGFDWKNHLKRDIAAVFHRTKAMQRFLVGKKIEIYNVYIATHEPVDDWHSLKQPMQLKEKNPLKMKVYYITPHSHKVEQDRFLQDIQVATSDIQTFPPEDEQENLLKYYQVNLANALIKKRQEKENVFTFGKPFFTYILLTINIFMFFILELTGGSMDIEQLIKFGAKYNPAILDGEWWRIISSMFLHIGALHLFMNMLAIYYLGIAVERIYGSFRFLIIYFLSGIGGGLASFAFTINVSAGASGALFGLFGALLYFGLNYKKLFLQTMGKGLLFIIGLNIVFGFIVPQIDMGAHLGGLITGFLASGIVHLPNKKRTLKQLLAMLIYGLIVGGLITIGIQNNHENATFLLMQSEEQIREGNYERAVQYAADGLEDPNDLEAELLFQRAYAYIKLHEHDLALNDLEKSVAVKDTIPEAHFNLALLYYELNHYEQAKTAIDHALELDSSNKEFRKLNDKIMEQLD